jgi:predicted MFS family arabinose efflux permease
VIRRLFQNYLDAFRGLPQAAWLISAILLINRSGTMVLPFWALYCTQERSLSPSDAGMLLAIYGVGGIVGSYLGGVWSSRFGPMYVQAGSLALTSVGFVMLMYAESWLAMVASLLFLSVSAESCRPASASATAALCPPEKHSRAFALNRLAINMGMTLGPTLGGFLAERDFQLLFIVDAATCFAAAVLATALAFRKSLKITLAAEREAGAKAKGPWHDVPFLISVALLFLVALAFFQLMGTYTLYLREHYGMKESRIGLLFAVNTVVIVLTEMWLIQTVERLNKLKVMAWGSLLSCLGFGLIQFGGTFAFAIFSVLVWTLGEMLCSPVAAAYVSGRATDANRGTYLGIYTMTFAAAFVFAPALGTLIYERDPSLVWNGCTVLGVATFVGYWLLARWDRPGVKRREAVPHATGKGGLG